MKLIVGFSFRPVLLSDPRSCQIPEAVMGMNLKQTHTHTMFAWAASVDNDRNFQRRIASVMPRDWCFSLRKFCQSQTLTFHPIHKLGVRLHEKWSVVGFTAGERESCDFCSESHCCVGLPQTEFRHWWKQLSRFCVQSRKFSFSWKVLSNYIIHQWTKTCLRTLSVHVVHVLWNPFCVMEVKQNQVFICVLFLWE